MSDTLLPRLPKRVNKPPSPSVAFGLWDRFRGDDKLMRIRDAAAPPADPDVYLTNLGVAKLGSTGNHAAIVDELLKLLKAPGRRGRRAHAPAAVPGPSSALLP